MSKVYIFLFVALTVFSGCAQNQSKIENTQPRITKANSQNISNNSNSEITYDCKVGNVKKCMMSADLEYSNKDYSRAIRSYDAICAAQFVPACIKMAGMFERGEGVSKNLDVALDIYTRACYIGYDKSCVDMERLKAPDAQ